MLNKPSDRISIQVQNLFSNVDPPYNVGPGAACGTAAHTEEEVAVLWSHSCAWPPCCGQQCWRVLTCAWPSDTATAQTRPAQCSCTAGAQIHFSVYGSGISSSAWAQVICGTFSINCSLFWELHISIWLCHIVWSFTTNTFEIYPCSGNC